MRIFSYRLLADLLHAATQKRNPDGRRVTQDEISKRAGVSRQYLNDLSKGGRPRPSAEIIAAIATALEVPMDALMEEAVTEEV